MEMVEIKFIFTAEDLFKVRTVFKLTEPPALRTVAFFDTSDRLLFSGGIVGHDLKLILRARFNPEKKHGKTTLKLRTTGRLDDSLQTDDSLGAKREFDFAFGRDVLDSYSLDDEQDTDDMEQVLASKKKVKGIFGDAQQALLEKVVQPEFSWSDLRIFGPVSRVQIWEDLSIPALDEPLTFELWDLPASGTSDARQILELSTRTAPEEQATTVQRVLEVLQKSDIRAATTLTKTQTVLQHFSPGNPAK